MVTRTDQAQREAYASNDRGVTIIETLELAHPAFAEPARVVSGVEEDMMLPLKSGATPVLFKACAFRATPPSFGDGGPSEWQISIDNVSSLMNGYLDATLGDNRPISVTYRAYRMNDLTGPGEVIEGYMLRSVDLTATSATGTLYLEDVALQAFPRATYSLTDFPGLWAA